MKKHVVLLVACMAALSFPARAQELPDINALLNKSSDQSSYSSASAPAMTPELKRQLQYRAAEKVGTMNDDIRFMADKENPKETREYWREQALNLFVGMGYAYEQDGIKKDGVTMETTSVYRKNPTRRLMRDYFTGLINLRYSQVKIETTEVADIKVSNLKKIRETEDGTEYECTCYFDQVFIGFVDGKPAYKDITRKKVTCRVLAENTVDGLEYTVFLGDVTALDTKRI